MREIPVVKLDDNYRAVDDELGWLPEAEIISTYSHRTPSRGYSITVIETAIGKYQPISSPDDMAQLLDTGSEDFICVDRCAAVNLRYVDGIDDALKLVVLKDKNGVISKACVSLSRFLHVKKFLLSYFKSKNNTNDTT